MRINASIGFWLLATASILWIVGSMFSEQGSPSPLNFLRAVGFGVAAFALQSNSTNARLLGAGVLLAGVADLLSFPTLLQQLTSLENLVEGFEFIGSLLLAIIGLRWIITGSTGGLKALRWAVLLVGLTALYWCFASINPTDWMWIPGNLVAVAGTILVFIRKPIAARRTYPLQQARSA